MKSIRSPRRGSTTSSPPATSQLALSIGDRSPTSPPPTSPGPGNGTSSLESAAGAMPYDSSASPTTPRSGRGVARVKGSPAPVAERASTILATSGPSGSISSGSAALASCLESKLRAAMASNGSILFSLIWKVRVTPAQRSISQLLAQAHRTSASDSTSWPTPVANDAKGSDYTYANGDPDRVCLKLGGAAKLSPWPTSRATDGSKGALMNNARQGKTGHDLPTIATRTQAPWATATAS